MAIRLIETTPTCSMCGEETVCIECKTGDSADCLLPLTDGERDVLCDALNTIRELQKKVAIEMSATDKTDLDSLIRKVELL